MSDRMKTDGLHLYRLDDGCEHVMAAKDEETARREGLSVFSIGEVYSEWDDAEPVTCTMIPDDEPFTLRFPDGLDGETWPPEGVVTQEVLDEDGRLISEASVTATAAEWARLCGDGTYVGGEES